MIKSDFQFSDLAPIVITRHVNLTQRAAAITGDGRPEGRQVVACAAIGPLGWRAARMFGATT